MMPLNAGEGYEPDMQEVLRNATTRTDNYGVQLDEMKGLIDEEDVFDSSVDTGPMPPFDECALKPEFFGEILFSTGRSIKIQRAAYNQIRPGYTVILYGPRRSGKSKFIKNICQRIRPWAKEAICFTKTKSSAEYFGMFPYDYVIDGLDEDILLDIFMMQKRLKEAESRGEDVGNYHKIIIIDDCMAEKLRYKDIFNMIFYNGRHLNCTLIVTCQDVKGIAPAATINTDLAYCFSLPDRRGRDTIREKFADYLDRVEFGEMMDSELINKKYHILCFDIAHRYNPMDNRISIGCVDENAEEKFVLGDRPMWRESEQQLIDLGMEHLLLMNDWGIIQ